MKRRDLCPVHGSLPSIGCEQCVEAGRRFTEANPPDPLDERLANRLDAASTRLDGKFCTMVSRLRNRLRAIAAPISRLGHESGFGKAEQGTLLGILLTIPMLFLMAWAFPLIERSVYDGFYRWLLECAVVVVPFGTVCAVLLLIQGDRGD